MSRGELDDFTLRRIFVEDVRRRVFLTGSPTAAPRAVMVGAQPGAGKTQVVAAAAATIPGSVRIVGDDLRRFHPDFVELMATDPLAMPGRTAQASGRWVEMCLQEAARERVSCVVESTFRSAQVGLATAGMLREAGFTVEVRAVAVPPAVSRLGTVQRYAAQLVDKGAGRWTPSSAHEQAVAGMPGTLAQLVTAGVVDQVQVVARDTRVLLAVDLPADGADRTRVVDDVARALAAGQATTALESAAAAHWVAGYARSARVLAEHTERDLDVLATMERLQAEAPAVVDQLPVADRDGARAQVTAAGPHLGAMRTQAIRAGCFPPHRHDPPPAPPCRTRRRRARRGFEAWTSSEEDPSDEHAGSRGQDAECVDGELGGLRPGVDAGAEPAGADRRADHGRGGAGVRRPRGVQPHR